MAHRIGKLFGNGPTLWVNMQKAIDMWDAERPRTPERPLNLATLQTIVAAGLFLASSMTGFAQAPGNEVRCSYGSRFTCNQSGCQPLEVEGAFLLVPRLDTIRTAFPGEKPPEVRRCDESGCTPVEVINGE